MRTLFRHWRRGTTNFFYHRYLQKRQEQSSYWASDKNTGVQNDPRGTGIKMSSKKILFDAVLIEKFDVQNRLFSVFSKKSKSGHFVLQISPWKQYPQKKWSTPRESQWKIQQNCRLRFLIFETLSQRFFTTKFLIIKKIYIFRFYDKNLRFRRSLKKPSQLLNGSTDFQYQYVKIKSMKTRTFWYIWYLWQKILTKLFWRSKKVDLLKIFRRIFGFGGL